MNKNSSQPVIERRFVKGAQVRAKSSDKPRIEGYASVFNESFDSGWFIETIKPTAFTRALAEQQDVRCLFNHDPNNVLGRSKSGTLRMKQDATGLHFECDTNPVSRIGSDVQAMIDRGDIDGCSFAFTVRKCSWREETDADGNIMDYRDIEDVDLYDVGPVTYPAYEGTSVSARSALLFPNGMPTEVRARIERRAEDDPHKTVDGEVLRADAFLIVGDAQDPETWHLPWKFSADEKTKSHLRDALARFDQVQGVEKDVKDTAWKRLLELCKEHGIETEEEKSADPETERMRMRLLLAKAV